MNTARICWLVVIFALGATLASGQTPETLVLQSQHSGLKHVFTPQGYQIQIDWPHSLAGSGQWEVEIESYESGQWFAPQWELGSLVTQVATVDPVLTTEKSPALAGTAFLHKGNVQVEVAGQKHAAKLENGRWTLDAKTLKPDLKPGVYDVAVAVTAEDGRAFVDNTTAELEIREKRDIQEREPIGLTVPMRHAFVFKHAFDPQAADRRYQRVLAAIEENAEKDLREGKIKSKKKGDPPPTLEAVVTAEIMNRIASYEASPAPPLVKLRTPKFSIQAKDKEREALMKLSRWIETDLLLAATDITPLDRLTPTDILKMHDEVFDILLARQTRDPLKYQYLSRDQVRGLENAVTVRLVGKFTPHLTKGQADQGFAHAPLVALGTGEAKSLFWQGRLAGTNAAQRIDWLRWKPHAPMPAAEIKPQAAQDCAWCVVEGADGMQALRVVAASPSAQASFAIRVQLPGATGQEVQFQTSPKRSLTFPF